MTCIINMVKIAIAFWFDTPTDRTARQNLELSLILAIACADFGVTLRQAQGGDAQSNAARQIAF